VIDGVGVMVGVGVSVDVGVVVGVGVTVGVAVAVDVEVGVGVEVEKKGIPPEQPESATATSVTASQRAGRGTGNQHTKNTPTTLRT
jgi:hypothetical protein